VPPVEATARSAWRRAAGCSTSTRPSRSRRGPTVPRKRGGRVGGEVPSAGLAVVALAFGGIVSIAFRSWLLIRQVSAHRCRMDPAPNDFTNSQSVSITSAWTDRYQVDISPPGAELYATWDLIADAPCSGSSNAISCATVAGLARYIRLRSAMPSCVHNRCALSAHVHTPSAAHASSLRPSRLATTKGISLCLSDVSFSCLCQSRREPFPPPT
jgi:hypothetical protein